MLKEIFLFIYPISIIFWEGVYNSCIKLFVKQSYSRVKRYLMSVICKKIYNIMCVENVILYNYDDTKN